MAEALAAFESLEDSDWGAIRALQKESKFMEGTRLVSDDDIETVSEEEGSELYEQAMEDMKIIFNTDGTDQGSDSGESLSGGDDNRLSDDTLAEILKNADMLWGKSDPDAEVDQEDNQ